MRSLVGEVVDRIVTKPGQAPVPYTGRYSGGLASMLTGSSIGDNREAQAAAYGANGTLFAIVGGIAVDTAAVEWGLWTKSPSGSGRPDGRKAIASHAAVDVWEHPNSILFKSRQSYVEVVQQHIDLTGEGWNLLARSRLASWPVELWPIYPHRITPVPSAQTALAGYVYRSPDGEEVPLEVEDVGSIRQPHPLDFLRGLGVVSAIATDLESAKEAGEWNRNFFRNSAVPGGIIEFPQTLQDSEFALFRDRWREQHQGVSNAHRVAMIEAGAKWVDRAYSMRDMQFVELRNVSREAIREAYRYPVAMLGESKDVNRAVAEAQKAIYAELILVPRLRRWKAWLNSEFLPAFGDTTRGLEFDFVSPVNGDVDAANAERESLARAAQMYIQSGWEPESVKTALGLPDALVWQGAPQQPQPALPADPAALRVDSWVDLTSGLLPHQHQHAITAAVEVPPELARVQEDWDTALDQLESDWAGGELEQREWILSELEAALAAGGVAALVASLLALVPSMTTSQADLLADAMASLASAASGRVVEEAAAQDVIISEVVLTSASFAAAATATATLAAARLAMSAAGEAIRLLGYGRTTAEVVADVRTHLEELSTAPRRAALGGQLTWAQNQARLETVRHAPVARYFATEILDSNTCTPCRKIDGEELPNLDAAGLAYGGGGYLFCEGTVRCRGTFRVVWTRREEQGD